MSRAPVDMFYNPYGRYPRGSSVGNVCGPADSRPSSKADYSLHELHLWPPAFSDPAVIIMGGALLVDYLETQVDLAWVQAEFGCTGDCRPVFEAFVEHPSWSCSGAPNISRAGSWIGHVFPGQGGSQPNIAAWLGCLRGLQRH